MVGGYRVGIVAIDGQEIILGIQCHAPPAGIGLPGKAHPVEAVFTQPAAIIISRRIEIDGFGAVERHQATARDDGADHRVGIGVADQKIGLPRTDGHAAHLHRSENEPGGGRTTANQSR